MERGFKFSVNQYYHLYNRGVEKREIFLNNSDYYRFLKLLYLCNSHKPVDFDNLSESEGRSFRCFEYDRGDVLVDIGAYVLMPNHFHILIKEKGDGGITKFMKKVCTGYSMYFNKKYKHSGTLFQGRFQATHLVEDRLLEYIYSYIHLNPVKIIEPNWKKNGIKKMSDVKKFLDGYVFSSYLDYKNDLKRELSSILNTEAFPGYFGTKREFSDMLDFWLDF